MPIGFGIHDAFDDRNSSSKAVSEEERDYTAAFS